MFREQMSDFLGAAMNFFLLTNAPSIFAAT
jgi:hypothetical protein